MKLQNQPYWDLLEETHYYKRDMDLEEVSVLLEFTKHMPISNALHIPFYFLDYTQRQYKIFTSTEQLGVNYHPSQFFDGGLDFILSNINKDDFYQINNVYDKIISVLKTTNRKDHLQYLFTFNYRVKSTSGKYIALLQKAKYITDKDTGLPLFNFGICTDITTVKADTSMMLRVDRYEQADNQQKCTTLIDNIFYPYPEDGFLTKREREILGWLAEGWATKQIASKLHICENTIANHRKNMLRKTNSKNVAELIKYGVKYGII